MKTLILFIASLAAVFSQGFRLNPITGQLDLVGGYTAPSGYTFTVTAQTSVTKTAADHGQGTMPNVACFNESDGEQASPRVLNPSFIGDITLEFSPAFTGRCWIRGPGSDAGAAGNVVGPASSTNAALACYIGTTGKVISGCSALSTAGAVPYVASAGVLTQDAELSYTAGTNTLNVVNIGGIAGFGLSFTGASNQSINFAGTGASSFVNISLNGSNVARFAATTGNLLLGTTTDGNYKLDIASSGSSGTLRVYDKTATTGSTLLAVQAGAGQSGNLVSIRNNAGTTVFGFTLNGIDGGNTTSTLYINGNTSIAYGFTGGNSLSMSSFGDISFKLYNGSSYVERARFIGNQTAGAGAFQLIGSTVAQLPAAAAGNAGAIQYVTDANATTIGSTVAGGGSNKVMVWSDGTNWKIYAN